MSAEEDRRKAFEELFGTHYWGVRAYVVRRANPSSVEDVLADTFLVAWRRLCSVPDDALPWLLGVARRVLANQRRAERRRGALDGRLRRVSSGSSPAFEPSAELGDEILRALASLTEREREALLLVAWEGLEPSRAAKAAGCTAAAFRVRLHRARRRLAAQLTENPAESPHPHVTEELP